MYIWEVVSQWGIQGGPLTVVFRIACSEGCIVFMSTIGMNWSAQWRDILHDWNMRVDQLVVHGQDMLEVVSTQVLSSPNIRQVILQSRERSSSIEPAIDDQDCSCYLAGKMKLAFGKLFRPG